MRFTQHYAFPVCAPSRYLLMTGKHSGRAYIRGNDEWGERGPVWNFKAMEENPFLEGQRPIPDSTLTIAEVLKEKGYTTGMVGKWGLGLPLPAAFLTGKGLIISMVSSVNGRTILIIVVIYGRMKTG
nr:sulfatase-like hydrolase/transferase [Paraflavitalea speifideiaquila]